MNRNSITVDLSFGYRSHTNSETVLATEAGAVSNKRCQDGAELSKRIYPRGTRHVHS